MVMNFIFPFHSFPLLLRLVFRSIPLFYWHSILNRSFSTLHLYSFLPFSSRSCPYTITTFQIFSLSRLGDLYLSRSFRIPSKNSIFKSSIVVAFSLLSFPSLIILLLRFCLSLLSSLPPCFLCFSLFFFLLPSFLFTSRYHSSLLCIFLPPSLPFLLSSLRLVSTSPSSLPLLLSSLRLVPSARFL